MAVSPLIQFPRADFSAMISEITDAPVLWNTEPEPFLGQVNGMPGYWLQLSMVHTETKGVDDYRQVYDPVNQVNGTTQISWRIYTIHFRVISYSMELPAFDVMDQIRRGLRSLTAKTGYGEIGIALVDWGKTIDIPVTKDQRETSECGLDVRFSWQVSADPGDDNGGIIESVGSMTGTLTQ